MCEQATSKHWVISKTFATITPFSAILKSSCLRTSGCNNHTKKITSGTRVTECAILGFKDESFSFWIQVAIMISLHKENEVLSEVMLICWHSRLPHEDSYRRTLCCYLWSSSWAAEFNVVGWWCKVKMAQFLWLKFSPWNCVSQ